MTLQLDQDMVLYAAIAFSTLLLLYAFFTGLRKTRVLGLILQILLGVVILAAGVYLLFEGGVLQLAIVLAALGALLVFCAVAFFAIHR